MLFDSGRNIGWESMLSCLGVSKRDFSTGESCGEGSVSGVWDWGWEREFFGKVEVSSVLLVSWESMRVEWSSKTVVFVIFDISVHW